MVCTVGLILEWRAKKKVFLKIPPFVWTTKGLPLLTRKKSVKKRGETVSTSHLNNRFIANNENKHKPA